MTKMSNAERGRYFSEKLKEQRHLLNAALDAMSEGDLTQALHVATIIRTLVHETGASKPLLKHLKPNYLDLPILDRIPTPKNPSRKEEVVFFCPVSAKIGASPPTVALMRQMISSQYSPSTLGMWWNKNPCMIIPALGPFFRKELVLGLANKEGGAHVDASIPRRYQLVLSSQVVHVSVGNTQLGPLKIARMVAGRSGVELLDCLDKNFEIS